MRSLKARPAYADDRSGTDAPSPLTVSYESAPSPNIDRGQVLIRVTASGLNRADALQMRGHYDPPEGVTSIPGLECAGKIIAAEPEFDAPYGVDITRALGDGRDVLALVPGGALGEVCAADAGLLLPVPSRVTAIHAVPSQSGYVLKEYEDLPENVASAALVEACATAWLNLSILSQVQPGQTVLVHGGSSGVGTMAIQIARALGAQVITTAGSPERIDLCEQLGAHAAFDYHGDVVSAVADMTHGRGVDLILDITGAGGMTNNLEMLTEGGRLSLIGLNLGTRATVHLPTIMAKRLHIPGAALRSSPLALRRHVIHDLSTIVWPMIEAGKIHPVIDTVYSCADSQEAFYRLAPSWFVPPENYAGIPHPPHPFGKLVITARALSTI